MHKAQIPNPALKQFSRLVGEWKTIGSHPFLPGKELNGHSSFKWIEGGAFLMWYSEIDEPNFPRELQSSAAMTPPENFS